MIPLHRRGHRPSPLLWIGVVLLGTACGSPPEGGGGFLLRSVIERAWLSQEALEEAGLAFPAPPELREVTIDDERRLAVLTHGGNWSWTGEVPPRGWLQIGVQAPPEFSTSIQRLEVEISAVYNATRETLDLARGDTLRWLDLGIDLSRFAGEEITLEFGARVSGEPVHEGDSWSLAWAPVSLRAVGSPQRERPNVLLIVVDTLRFDRLTPYGYPRETSPAIQQHVADRGTVVEEAYAQAPWTLPSMVSMMTGLYPGSLLRSDASAFAIPPQVPSLGERMAALGYETAAFIANPTLHDGNGFARGFATFYTPPAATRSLELHAEDELHPRLVAWLRAFQSRPFFLYVHYMDPHDPYENPDLVEGHSPFYPDYGGHLSGRSVHGIYAGQVSLDKPADDLRHLAALYDSEVRYVDRFIGRILASLEEDVVANTLVVMTADHGEELFDHGGWKHGETLYEEQIHVPLLLRWEDRIPAGERLRGTVRLLDLVPTLLAAVGTEVPGGLPGVNLLPALLQGQPLPRRPAFAQHLAAGPLRAAAMLDRKKLILFNPRAPFAPPDELRAHLWRKDLERLQRIELYDLDRDPRERENLASAWSEQTASLASEIHRRLGSHLRGLRVVATGFPHKSSLRGRLLLDRPPAAWQPYFLGPQDRVEVDGRGVSFHLQSEHLEKGFLLQGDLSSVQEMSVSLDGVALPAGSVLVGSGAPYGGGAVSRQDLLVSDWPGPLSAPALRLFWPSEVASVASVPDPETRRRLQALGYLE